MLDTVGALDDECQGHAGDGPGPLVAQQGGDVDLGARAIDAALGEGIGIERARCGPPGHAAIAEIEGPGGEIEKGVVAVLAFGHDKRRLEPPFTACEARCEVAVAAGIGSHLAQDLIVAGDETEPGARRGHGGLERADKDMNAVLSTEGRQAEVRDHEPLGGLVLPVAGAPGSILGLGDEHIDARLQTADGLAHGECGGHLFIEAACDRKGALPDQLTALGLEPVDLIARIVALKLSLDDGRRKPAIADAIDLERNLLGVDGDERQALLAGARQHIAAPAGAHRRRAVAHIDVELGRLEQALADGRRQAGADRNLVALAMREPLEAELAILDIDGRRVAAVD